MTKEAALYQFFSSFGLTAYEENSVPETASFPYLTYPVSTADFGTEVSLSPSLWFKSESWLGANIKSREISHVLGRGGKVIPCDGGAVWIRKGSPFAQNMGDDSNKNIKRVYINLTVEFFTTD